MGAAGNGGQAARRRETGGLLSILGAALAGEEPESTLPPGRRDASGFWYPAHYREPRELFTAHQRTLQEKQRDVHRRRRSGETAPDMEPLDAPLPLPAPLRESTPD
ncbi:MAG TPA: hypothetical protein VGQ67_14805 [Candidatus Polarisedimenticolia bacterium]|jgi:hypothetical protein|nr:hypothetical protein [Candidatus Polarisedimenticolia bacterium]